MDFSAANSENADSWEIWLGEPAERRGVVDIASLEKS
jgi:hypothetical protein